MLGHTKKRHTNKSSYTRTGKDEIEEDSIPWREVVRSGIKKFTEVGLVLKGARVKANLTQLELAKKIGAKPHHISEMEHGKRTIGKNMAKKLAKIFKLDYRVFL
jgi:ribosome-binding protein aMBF1 (putative translation factor)